MPVGAIRTCSSRLECRSRWQAVGCPTQNAYAERLIRTLKDEEVYLHEYETFAEAQDRIGHFLEDVYMHKRIHSSLGYLTPAEFEAGYLLGRSRKVGSES